MVEVGTGKRGSKYIKTNYPNEEGLTAGTTTQEGRSMFLIPEYDLVDEREQRGIY